MHVQDVRTYIPMYIPITKHPVSHQFALVMETCVLISQTLDSARRLIIGRLDGSYGVIPYMVPELLWGRPHSKASDMYAFGMIMWELSAGEPPFSDCEHNEGRVHSRHF